MILEILVEESLEKKKQEFGRVWRTRVTLKKHVPSEIRSDNVVVVCVASFLSDEITRES